MKRKDYATAILLNLLLPGTGYVYAGRAFLGTIVFLMAIGSVIGYAMGIEALSGVAGFLSVIGAIDGYLTVRKHNDRVSEANNVPCPNCAEPILRNAKVCKHCQRSVAA